MFFLDEDNENRFTYLDLKMMKKILIITNILSKW